MPSVPYLFIILARNNIIEKNYKIIFCFVAKLT